MQDKPFYLSKKFWTAVVALVFVFIGEHVSLSQEQVGEAVMVLITLIGGFAAADFGKEAKGNDSDRRV